MSKLRVVASILIAATTLACKGSADPQAQPEAASEPASASEAVAANPPTPPPEPTPAQAEPASPPVSEAEPPPAGPSDAAAPTGEAPTPELVPPPADPGVDPLLALLGDGDPRFVEVVTSHEHGRAKIVLYRIDLASRWRASLPDTSELLEKLDEQIDQCIEEVDYSPEGCSVQAAIDLGVDAGLAEHLAWANSRAWELAHVEFDRQGQGRVLARKRLLEFGIIGDGPEIETKLKVYDIDRDKRSEVLVVFGFSGAPDSNLETVEAAVGYILDKADFHVQYATTRRYVWEYSDMSTNMKYVDTTWLGKDDNGDGFPDLSVRETRRETRSSEYEDDDASDERGATAIVCPYELAGDRWVCPEALGTEIIDGSKLVESTTIPVVLEPPPTPGAATPG